MKYEFVECLNILEERAEVKLTDIGAISEEDYRKIETVYTYHPAISNSTGKMEIAKLYFLAGMGLIDNMHSEACIAKDAERERRELMNKLDKINSTINSYKHKYELMSIRLLMK